MKRITFVLLLLVSSKVVAGITFFSVESVSTVPINPQVSQSFEVRAQGQNRGCDFGGSFATIQGQTITVNLNITSCGPNISPFPYRTYIAQIPGLQRGQYRIEVFENTAVDNTNPLTVSGVFVGPKAVPTLGQFGSLFLVGLVLLVAKLKMSYNLAFKRTSVPLAA